MTLLNKTTSTNIQVKQQQYCEREWNRQVSESINNNVVAIGVSRKQEHEHSTSLTFVRLFV